MFRLLSGTPSGEFTSKQVRGSLVKELDREWSWVGEDGIERHLDESSLTLGLSAEEIPVYALVCRRGWSEWLPAMQVGELQWAIPPGRADSPRKPEISEASQRPAPPLHRLAEYRRRADGIAAGRIVPQLRSTRPPPVAKRSEHPRRESLAPRLARFAREDLRRSQPDDDYSDADAEEPTVQIEAEEVERALSRHSLPPNTERPSAAEALLPSSPGRGSLGASHGSSPSAAEAPSPSSPAIPSSTRSAPSAPPVSTPAASAPLGSHPSVTERSLGIPSAPSHGSAPQVAPSAPSPDAVAIPASNTAWTDAGTPPTATIAPNPALPPQRKALLLSIGGASLLGVVAALWIRSNLQDSQALPIESSRAAAPTAPAPKPPPGARCELARGPTRLAEWAHPKIRPVIASVPNSRQLAVGYAQTSRFAVGIAVDPDTLSVEKTFSDYNKSPLLSVVPMVLENPLTFRPSRAASTLQSAITIDATTPFAFGLSQSGLAIRRDTDLVDEVLWSTNWETVNVPSTVRIDPQTHAVALRAGGERGSLLVGKISEQGKPLGELARVDAPDERVGPPSITAGTETLLLAFSSGSKLLQENLYVARSSKSELPVEPRLILSSDSGAASPELVELSVGGYLIQYTQGKLGEQQVVARVLQPNLELHGEPLTLSKPEQDGHQGALFVRESDVYSFYMVRAPQNHELWATHVRCR